MNYLIIGIIQSVPILVTIVILGIRLEHRITKIETDVTWIKRLTEMNCGKCKGNEGD